MSNNVRALPVRKTAPRMKNPVEVVPAALKALVALGESSSKGGVSRQTLELVHLRASQINGCSQCVQIHSRALKDAGEHEDRIFAVSAWRESLLFDDAERAALALTEAVTRLSDRSDPVSDDVWAAVEEQFDEHARADLILHIGQINLWNRLNVTIRQPAIGLA